MNANQATASLVSAAADAAGASAAELAQLLGVSQPAAWDVLTCPNEVSTCLSLRQLARLAARLRISPLSLLSVSVAPAQEHRSLAQLAAEVSAYCAAHHLSIEQFSESAGWSVQQLIAAPESALDDWCLDALTDVCRTLGFHWPDYLPQ